MTSKRHSNAILIPGSRTLSKSLKQLLHSSKTATALLKLVKTQLKYQLAKQNMGYFIKVNIGNPPNHYLGWNDFCIKNQMSQFLAKEESTKAYLSSFILFVIKKGIRLVIKTTNPGIMSSYPQDGLLRWGRDKILYVRSTHITRTQAINSGGKLPNSKCDNRQPQKNTQVRGKEANFK